MARLRLPKLTVPDLVRLYESGQTLFAIGLRAGMPEYRVRGLLVTAGVQLRTQVEVIRLSNLSRADTNRRRKAKLEAGGAMPPPGFAFPAKPFRTRTRPS